MSDEKDQIKYGVCPRLAVRARPDVVIFFRFRAVRGTLDFSCIPLPLFYNVARSEKMIRIQNLSKSYGAQLLFDEATFNVNPREKIGLVGRNGHGKTTLMRLVTGEEFPDDGDVEIAKNYRIGYITQHLKFTAANVHDEVCLGLQDFERDETWKAEKILSGLGFSKDDFFARSGGILRRLSGAPSSGQSSCVRPRPAASG